MDPVLDDNDPIKIKLIVLGDSSVGKTSLIRRFVENHFLPNEAATIGFDFKPCKVVVDGKTVQFNIWDTAGAERYSGYLTPSFYRQADGALYVYDVTSPKSLTGVTYWVEQTEQFSGTRILKMLVGNKIDLPDKQVTKQEGSEFARRAGMLFVETSAKADVSVRDAFIELVRKILQDPEFNSVRMPEGIPLAYESNTGNNSQCSC